METQLDKYCQSNESILAIYRESNLKGMMNILQHICESYWKSKWQACGKLFTSFLNICWKQIESYKKAVATSIGQVLEITLES